MSDPRGPEADRLLEEALARNGGEDPRVLCRQRLRELKQADAAAYEEAVGYYRDVLLPGIAEGATPPLDAWTEYGRRLAAALAPGRTVSIDRTGRARPYEGPDPADLVLQLPEGEVRALLVAAPADPSPAQRATRDALVEGKQRLPG